MDEYKSLIFMEIMGIMNLNEDTNYPKIINNYNEYELKFLELEEDYKDDKEFLKVILECHRELLNLYNTIILKYIEKFRKEKFSNNSIDYIILNIPQEELFMKLENFAKENGLPDSLRNDLFDKVKFLGERLDKRFCFDDIALINLIEASSGKNIATEEGLINHYNNRIVSHSNGQFVFRTSSDKDIYTLNGKKIINPSNPIDKSENDILLKSFPLGNEVNNFSRDTAMKKVMQILFDNFSLCIETYKSVYKAGDNKVHNTAKLTNGSTFEFEYIINERNIPHLLGILPGRSLSTEAIDFLNTISNKTPCELNSNSKAYEVLMVIYKNKKSIIEAGGLYEGSDGKLYEIMNWEKMILKTSSFMRCDFFKTCFCIAKLSQNKYLNNPKDKGGYVGIASTEYEKGLNSTKSARSVLNDLLNTRRQRKDFVFRGFHLTNNGIYVPNSIMTGKAEKVYVGKNNELLKSLQRYRELFDTSSDGVYVEPDEENSSSETSSFGGEDEAGFVGYNDETISSIVKEIENDKFIKTFPPEEIASLGLDISRNLGFVPHISKEALDVIQEVNSYDNQIVTNEELENLEKSNGMKK